jgi:very-short-patch-repair endonuclease
MQIKGRDYSINELQKIADSCFDRTAFIMALGWTYYNGRMSKKVDEIVKETDISIEHFDATKKNKERRKYPIVKKICPVCGKEFETQLGGNEERITCSYSCSNVYFATNRYTEKAKKKISESMIKWAEKTGVSEVGVERIYVNGHVYRVYDKICLTCGKSFKGIKKRRYCSQTCSAWLARHNVLPSFPERVVMNILQELSLSLEREFNVGRWFIDFADIGRKIAIEIDGGQHLLPERRSKDKIKDAFLISQGWQVNRIPWKRLTKESREELKNTIHRILTGFGV